MSECYNYSVCHNEAAKNCGVFCADCLERENTKPCETDGCTRRVKKGTRAKVCLSCAKVIRDMRQRNYMRERRRGDVDRPFITDRPCLVVGCKNQVSGYRLYCSEHRAPKQKEQRTHGIQTVQNREVPEFCADT